jgi:hypothetical protein
MASLVLIPYPRLAALSQMVLHRRRLPRIASKLAIWKSRPGVMSHPSAMRWAAGSDHPYRRAYGKGWGYQKGNLE